MAERIGKGLQNLLRRFDSVQGVRMFFYGTSYKALEDFKWMSFSLEFCGPRLYKLEDKRTVDPGLTVQVILSVMKLIE